MIIKKLSLKNFRNFDSAEINFNERLNIIIGDNGQGKTNIIEAINLLMEGESFRYSKNENIIQIGKSESIIRSETVNENLDYVFKLKLEHKKKDFFVNEKPTSFSKLKKLSIVLFSPESLNIIKESSDERRKLADQLILQTVNGGSILLHDFKKVLKTRNKLLKDLAEQKINYSVGIDTLESINILFLELAAKVAYFRVKLLNEIKEEVEIALNKIDPINKAKFDFDYIFSDKNYKNSQFEILLEAMRNRMHELLSAEIKSGISLVGPQKHDVIFLYNGNDSRFYCSQGQQRSIILAYKMAQIVYHKKIHGFYPLLLLDDVLSELDLLKQESLISTLNQTETQTFVTTTDVSLLSKLSMNKANVFKIQNGQVII